MLEKLDKDFLAAVDAAGINRNQVSLADAGVQLGRLRWRQKDTFREKTYQVKLTSASQLEAFISKIESVKIEFADVIRLSHSDLQKMKLELKIKALQAAKTKAEALVKSIGSELGKPLFIQEIEFDPYIPSPGYTRGKITNVGYSYGITSDDKAESGVEFKKIKLQAQVNAKFEIK